MIIEHLKCLPFDIELDVLFDIDRAVEAAIEDGDHYLMLEKIMSNWFDLIIVQASKCDSIGQSDASIEEYFSDIPGSMEDVILYVCELAGFCVLMDDVVINSPQRTLFKTAYKDFDGLLMDQNVTSEGGLLWLTSQSKKNNTY